MDDSRLAALTGWFEAQGWEPFGFQREVWRASLGGESGLVHAATGTGKTYAAWFAGLQQWLRDQPADVPLAELPTPKLQVLWLTPLRALAADTEQALRKPIDELGLNWTIERRTGDTSSYRKQKQLKKPPSALITTPESLSLLLARK